MGVAWDLSQSCSKTSENLFKKKKKKGQKQGPGNIQYVLEKNSEQKKKKKAVLGFKNIDFPRGQLLDRAGLSHFIYF